MNRLIGYTIGALFVVAFVLGIQYGLWLVYENAVRAVFTSMPATGYWQFFGICFLISVLASWFKK